MAVNQAVQWSSTAKISCAGPSNCCGCSTSLSANVILCVASSLTESGLGFIEAVLTQEIVTKVTCTIVYKYTFEYDDAQLAVPEVPLVASQISGVFCLDCRATWTEELISQYALLEVQDTTTVDLTLTETEVDGVNVDTISAVVIVSPAEGNCIEITPEGLFSPCGEEFNSKYFPLSTYTGDEVCTEALVFTNLLSYTVPANTLLNAGDRLEFDASGTLVGLDSTVQIRIGVFGLITLTGLSVTQTTWRARGTITFLGLLSRSTVTGELDPAGGTPIIAIDHSSVGIDVTNPNDFEIRGMDADGVGGVCLIDFNINKILAPV